MKKYLFLIVSLLFCIISCAIILFQIKHHEKNNDNFFNGLKSFAIGRYSDAVDFMTRYIENNSENYIAYYIRGMSRYNNDYPFVNYEHVIDFEQSLKLKNDSLNVKISLSNILLELLELSILSNDLYERNSSNNVTQMFIQADFESIRRLSIQNYFIKNNCLKKLDRIIELNEKNHKALYYRGLVKYFRAKYEFEKGSLSKDNSEIITDIVDFDNAIKYKPTAGFRCYYTARALSKHNLHLEYISAIKDYEMCAYIECPNNDLLYTFGIEQYDIWFRMGQCYFASNDYINGINAFEQAKKLCPNYKFREIVNKIDSEIELYKEKDK